MMSKINIEDYVDDIVRDLPHSKYTSRFREELLEHSEDCTRELEEKNETDISEKIMQKIGNKDLLVKRFKNFHREFFSKLWPLAAIFYGIIFSPMLIMTSIILSVSIVIIFMESVPSLQGTKPYWSLLALLANYTFYKIVSPYVFIHVRNNKFLRLLAAILLFIPFFTRLPWGLIETMAYGSLAAILAMGINYILYKFVAIRLSVYFNGKKRMQNLLALLLLPPLTLLSVACCCLATDIPPEDIYGHLYPLLMIPIIPSLYLPAYMNFKRVNQNKNKMPSSSRWYYLTPVVFLAGAILILAGTYLSFYPSNLPEPWSYILWPVCMPLFAFFIMTSALYYLIQFIVLSVFNAIITQLMMSWLVILLAASGLYLTLSPYKVNLRGYKYWLKSFGLIVCLNSLFGFSFFFIGKTKQPEIAWQIPVVDVSQKIEKQQFGWLYPVTPSYNNSIGSVIDEYTPTPYKISSQDNNFTIYQEKGYVFAIDTENIPSLPELKIAQQGENFEHSSHTFTDNQKDLFQNGFECTKQVNNSCAQVGYEGREILKDSSDDSSVYISDIKLNANKDWAMFIISSDGVTRVYLADLRSPATISRR